MKDNITLKNFSHPSKILLKNHSKDIFATRETLFKSLSKQSAIRSASKAILNRKLSVANRKKLPGMFELFPWVIKDLVEIKSSKVRDISVNWLCIYLAVTVLDDYLDTREEIKPEEIVTSSLLAQKGILSLFKIVHGTKYEKLFEESIFKSASFQLTDVLEQVTIYKDPFRKEESASGKNQILIACAGALAASTEKNSDFIIKLTKQILLISQYLDDIADFEEDLSRKNYTVLLNGMLIEKKFSSRNVDRYSIIEDLIESGSLLNVITRIEVYLVTVIKLINRNVVARKNNPSCRFFYTLHKRVAELKHLLKVNSKIFKNEPKEKKDQIVKLVDDFLTNIYMHT